MGNIHLIDHVEPEIKIKLLGSIFSEKVEFDGKNNRTRSLNTFFEAIFHETKDAKDYLSKMRRRDPELAKGWGQIVHPLIVRTSGGPQKENLRDNMTNEELVMNMLAELTTSNITKEEHPETM